MTLPFDELETVYEALAEALDAAGPERETLFLTRLALLLAKDFSDAGRVKALIGEALEVTAKSG